MSTRTFLTPCALACALVLLVPAVALAAGGQGLGGSPTRLVTPGLQRVGPVGMAGGAAAPGATSPAPPRLGIISDGPCTVTGVVEDLAGAPIAGATVIWGYYDAAAGYAFVFGAETTTAVDGSFSFAGVRATSEGEIDVVIPGSAGYDGYQSWSLTFSPPPTANDFTLRPGVVPFSTTRTSRAGWGSWKNVVVETWGSLGGGTTTLADPTRAAPSVAGDVFAMPPDYFDAAVFYHSNQAAEWVSLPAPPVAAGGSGATPIDVSQDDAQSILITRPYWASGRPGATVRLSMGNWPTGRQASFYGYSEYPFSFPIRTYVTTYTSNGSDSFVSLTVPTNATPGYDYQLHAYRSDTTLTQLDIADYFQVCTLKSSRTSVRRGGAIRLSGVIPTQGHVGSAPGKVKLVTVFKRTTSATAAPTYWNPVGHGWTKVVGPYWNGTFKANGLGKFLTGYLRPTRTTWYVVRYPGDDWYWGAYTSVLKVRVY